MTDISRRSLLWGGTSLALAGCPFGAWGAESNHSIAIIDTPDDTRPFLDGLQAADVRVVARYYARGPQCDLAPRKRIATNTADYDKQHVCPGVAPISDPSEFEQLLDPMRGMGILSIYQYNSSEPGKFLFGLDSNGDVNQERKPNTDHVACAYQEAIADADAALAHHSVPS